jgi:hypothetical protein
MAPGGNATKHEKETIIIRLLKICDSILSTPWNRETYGRYFVANGASNLHVTESALISTEDKVDLYNIILRLNFHFASLMRADDPFDYLPLFRAQIPEIKASLVSLVEG